MTVNLGKMFSLSPSNTDPSVALQRTAHPIRSTPVPPMDRIWIESGMIATEGNQLADGEQPTSRQVRILSNELHINVSYDFYNKYIN